MSDDDRIEMMRKYKDHEFRNSLDLCDRILDTEPEDPFVCMFKALGLFHLPYGRIYDDQLFTERGINWTNKALEIEPDHPILLHYRSVAHYQLARGMYGKDRGDHLKLAIDGHEKCVKATPSFPIAWFYLAREYSTRIPEGSRGLPEAYKPSLDAYNECARAECGFSGRSSSDPVEQRLIEKNRCTDRIRFDALYNSGMIHQSLSLDHGLHDHNEIALEAFNEALDHHKGVEALTAMALTYQAMGSFIQALQIWDELLIKDQLNSEAMYNIATIRMLTGKDYESLLQKSFRYNEFHRLYNVRDEDFL